MDKLLNAVKDYATIQRYLEAINQTTDDYLFMLDIPHDKIQIFGNISEYFEISDAENAVVDLRDILCVIHPSDSRGLLAEIDRIRQGVKGTYNVDFRMYNRRGEMVWVNFRGNVLHDENGAPYLMIGRLSEEALRHLFNPLTGLWNKTKFREDLKKRLGVGKGWLMMLGIPSLADINLSQGRNFGNQILCEMADILERMEWIENVYHIDHNNFAVVIRECDSVQVTALYEQICQGMNEKCMVFAGVVPIDSNIFIDVSPLIDSANITLRDAEQNSAGGIEFFSSEEIEQRIKERMLLKELKESVQNNFEGFEVWYQPQIKSGDYTIYGVEALLRYQSKKKGRVFPDEFIPILEQSGLIDAVGMWVLKQALTQCKIWREHIPSLHVAVNFSSVQFDDRRLGEKIVDMLKAVQLPGNALTVELTESVQLNANKHYYDLIKYIKSYGVRFSIDDFGTGYSNLGYLKQLDVSEIKIDRSFVSEIEKNTYNYRLISTVIEFAKTNAIYVFCEGIETTKELSALETLRADFFQGFLFDKPCTADEITEKYICTSSDLYKARLATIDEIYRFREQFGTIHFDPKNILRANDIGLWILRINETTNQCELYTDDVMERILGLTEKLTPGACYEYWYSHISPQDKKYVDDAVNLMKYGGKAVQLGYRWMHPTIGEVTVRSSGVRTPDAGTKIVLEGYHRILTGVAGA